MYLGDIYTISVNLAGLPAVSLPCGLDRNGLPIGLQLIGDCFQEKTIIRAAYAFEKTRDCRRSPLAEGNVSAAGTAEAGPGSGGTSVNSPDKTARKETSRGEEADHA